jgi:starvation-inducible outer membrane lipoprotein
MAINDVVSGRDRGTSRVATALIAIGVVATLAGCASPPPTSTEASSPTHSKSPTSTPAQTSSPSVEPAPSSSATPFALTSVAMDKTCGDILGLQKLYDYDPNVALVTGRTPTMSPVAAEQVRLGGITCVIVNLSSSVETEIVATRLTEASASFKSTELSATPNYQVNNVVRGVFTTETGQFVSGNYWVSVSSPNFTSPVDASQMSFLVASAL